jgi:hypothetical protein
MITAPVDLGITSAEHPYRVVIGLRRADIQQRERDVAERQFLTCVSNQGGER